MLLKMVPEAISAAWPQLEKHIKRAMPEAERSDSAMSTLLNMLLIDRAHCWVSYDSENNNRANFVVVTIPTVNTMTGEKNLLLYNVTNSNSIDMKTSNRMWLEGYQAIGKFMRANGFKKLVSYFETDNKNSYDIAKKLDANIMYYSEIPIHD